MFGRGRHIAPLQRFANRIELGGILDRQIRRPAAIILDDLDQTSAAYLPSWTSLRSFESWFCSTKPYNRITFSRILTLLI